MNTNLETRFKNEFSETVSEMPKGHEARFLLKLEEQLPQKKRHFNYKVAASIVLLIGLTFSSIYLFNGTEAVKMPIKTVEVEPINKTKTLGDISPDLKKVEDYYLANINLQLASLTITPDNKMLFDGYLEQLERLNTEYNKLNEELTETGVSQNLVNALITNLKLRLNLMHRLDEQIKELESIKSSKDLV